MCGRFGIYEDQQDLAKRFRAAQPDETLRPRYNAAPTQLLPVIPNREPRKIELFRWGLVPSWAQDLSIGNKMINARAETLAEKPSFRSALKKRRCIVPVNGFYEWQKLGKEKQPVWIGMKSREPFPLAGLWETWTDRNSGEIIKTFTIITTSANELVEPVHNRMPAILKDRDLDLWLSDELGSEEALQLLLPFDASAMSVQPVGKLVNNPANDAPECVRSISDGGQEG